MSYSINDDDDDDDDEDEESSNNVLEFISFFEYSMVSFYTAIEYLFLLFCSNSIAVARLAATILSLSSSSHRISIAPLSFLAYYSWRAFVSSSIGPLSPRVDRRAPVDAAHVLPLFHVRNHPRHHHARADQSAPRAALPFIIISRRSKCIKNQNKTTIITSIIIIILSS
jgi:hypothetical protein